MCRIPLHRSWTLLVALSVGFVFLPADAARPAKLSDTYGDLPLHFEVNQGQTDAAVKFLARGPGSSLYLTSTVAVLVLARPRAFTPVALRMSLVGGAPLPKARGLDELPGKTNYLIGKDPARWRTHVPTYARVQYSDVYPGIDLVYHGNQGQLEYDFVVAPGADPRYILLDFEGADRIEIDSDGDLVLHTEGGALRQHKPLVYQGADRASTEIAGRYVLRGRDRVAFEVGAYDRDRPLVIDPVITYATYLGGSDNDSPEGIAVDTAGNAYVVGSTVSLDFPTTQGAFQTNRSGGGDLFVTKLDASGSALVYSTYLGGSGSELVADIAVDANGSAYVTGGTGSVDFPTTAGAFQPSLGGGGDAFVTKLDPSGAGLAYSTYLGGTGGDTGAGISVDAHGNAYITGGTAPDFFSGLSDFPTTPGAFQPANAGGVDAFVTKLNPLGSTLVYSTYLGGRGNTQESHNDSGASIAVDADDNAYVTGNASSTNFPTTAGALQPARAGHPFLSDADAFVTKMNPTGSALVYSTYLGGGFSDAGAGIAVDANGDAYVTGITRSSNFPTTPGAFQPTFGSSSSDNPDAFVAKLDRTGSTAIFATFLGGSSGDSGADIALDVFGNPYVTGGTRSLNFPTAEGAFQRILDGPENAFITKLDTMGTGLVYSTYLGGSNHVRGVGIAADTAGNAYLAGVETRLDSHPRDDFPVTPGAFQPAFGGGIADAFVAKINDAPFVDSTPPTTTATTSPNANDAGWNNSAVTVTLRATDNEGGSGVATLSWRLDNGTLFSPRGGFASFTVSTEGAHVITYFATDKVRNVEAEKTLFVRIDRTAPTGTLALSPNVLWPPDRRLVTITQSTSVSDNLGGAVTIGAPVVTSNEPEIGRDSSDLGPDWVVNGDTLQLRAEREATGPGRVYNVTRTLTDEAGNSAQISSAVTVPRNQ